MAAKRPAETRRRIVASAFWEIYRQGFQSSSIDRILDGTQVTRGALFHHFPSKQHLGYAVVDEAVAPWIDERWITPLAGAGSVADGIASTVNAYLDAGPDEIIIGGCPLNNLIQEMAALDEGFRVRLDRIATAWRSTVTDLWHRTATPAGSPDDAARWAGFIVSSIEGLLGAAKLARSRAPADEAARLLVSVIRTAGAG
ncbi:MAG TPA: TetR/AcrR family transcriptional regulator [Vicinamibacterales bacterium]|nr:TetR/AcrR family transcriptional regulator [Vicinamibacterales bacterium]